MSVVRPFPIELYKPLATSSFDRVNRAVEQLLRAIAALNATLGDLEDHIEDVKVFLQVFAFQSYHLLLLSDEASAGIQLACTAFEE